MRRITSLVTHCGITGPRVGTLRRVAASVFLMYGEHWQNSLELYVPTSGCPPFPVGIYVHGGGWLSGDSSEIAPVCRCR
jgi:acetyl esterase/lipase